MTLVVLTLWVWAVAVSLRTFWARYRGRPWARALLVLGAIVGPHILVVVALTRDE